jgi:hypothetical protein
MFTCGRQLLAQGRRSKRAVVMIGFLLLVTASTLHHLVQSPREAQLAHQAVALADLHVI